MISQEIDQFWQERLPSVRPFLSPNFPIIVCLCGSTRFYQAFQEANYRETMAGKIVLTVGFYPHTSMRTVTVDGCMGPQECQVPVVHNESVGCDDKQKEDLDKLHFRKIDLADEVLFLNVGGYMGFSTKRELEHAKSRRKVIRFLEDQLENKQDVTR